MQLIAGYLGRTSTLRIAARLTVLASVVMTSFATRAAAPDSRSGPDRTDGANNLEEVIVTAQKRTESVQSTPLAVTALTGEMLERQGITTVASLSQQVPSLNVTEQVGQARLTLRGVGVDNIAAGSEGSVAFNTDGVYYARSSAALAGFYDIARVEVLRGPQGTLYGRNATGGSVNIITHRPMSEFSARASVTLGNLGTANTEGAITGPLGSDTVRGRLSFQTQHHDGYGENIVTGNDIDTRDSQALRGQLEFRPSDDLTILFSADYFQSDDRSNGFHYLGAAGLTAPGAPVIPTGLLLGGFVPGDVRDIASAHDPRANAKFYGALVDVNYQVNSSVALRSITAYRRSDYHVDTDISPTALDLFRMAQAEDSKQFSQELQLNIETDRNKLVAGLYYLHEDMDGFLRGPVNLLLVGGPDLLMQGYFAGGALNTRAAALYGQDTFSVTPDLRFTLGARYSIERKSVDEQSDFDLARPYAPSNVSLVPHRLDDHDFYSFTPKVGVDFNLTPDTLLYASYSKGFKAGTYNLGALTPPLQPENVDAYDIGMKTTLFDGRLRANLSAFHYNYKDLQVTKVVNVQLVLENAASASIDGIEGEFAARPFDMPLLFSLNVAFLHARFDEYVTADNSRPGGDGRTIDPSSGLPAFDLHGNALAQAPDTTLGLGVEYTWNWQAGAVTVRGEGTWVDRTFFSPFNRTEVSQAPYRLLNFFVNYEAPGEHWTASAYVKNATDETILTGATVDTPLLGSAIIGYVQPPRTYGVTVGYRF